MFTRIVVGTDGSPQAHDAVRRAAELGSVSDAELHIVSACEPVPWRELQEIREDLPEEFRDLVSESLDAEERIRLAARICSDLGVPSIAHARTGDASTAILDVAREVRADLVVVGARGMHAVERFLRGSVSTRVAHHAPCDVLIVEHAAV